jgi:mRNA interferase YafQ
MRTIERSTAFKRDYKREMKGVHRLVLEVSIRSLLIILIEDKQPGPRYRDHELSGNWAGYRECHLKPDLLLIYQKSTSDVLRLARLGSHSEIFG